MTSYASHGVSNHRQPDCVFGLTRKGNSSALPALWGGSTVFQWNPSQSDNNAASVSMSCRLHVTEPQISPFHYDDVIMTMLASQITSLTVVYSIVYSGVNQRKHQTSASLAFVWEIHRGPVNFPHKWPVTRKMFPFDDVIMSCLLYESHYRFPFIISALNPFITVQRVLIAYGNNPMVTLMIGV